MSKLLEKILLVTPSLLGIFLGGIAANGSELINEISSDNELIEQLQEYSQEEDSLEQVTNVNQLRDVSPTDWAFEALRNLVERYGCIVGYPSQVYLGNQSLSRYEFAAGLNACLTQMERLIAASEAVLREDLETLQRLIQEFEAELAALGARVDNLEGRVAFLEDHQFSTTTKLQGEVIFGLAQEFNRGNEVVFQDRVRLSFVSSFTGKDALYVRLDAGNAAFFDNLDQGAFTYSFDNENTVEIGWLAYYFPIGENIQVYLPAAFPLWVDFVPSISPYLEGFTGGTASLSSFGESSPIYKIGLAAGGGIGFNFDFVDTITISAGYFGGNSFDPSEGNGLFNGEYSALAQIAWFPNDKLQLAFTYVRGYFVAQDNVIFDLGVGTENARSPFEGAITTNSFGIQGAYQISSAIAVNAFGMFTDANQTDTDDNADIWSYGVGIAFPDLGKEGNLGGIIIGAEPYVGGCSGSSCEVKSDDVALHVEGFYKYQLNENISITPGIIWINAPFGDSDREAGIIGSIRTTFTF